MPSKPKRLSKSRVQSGAQCRLKLWYDCFARELAPPVDELLQFIFDRGTQIGLLAQQRYPGGKSIDAKYYETELALHQTQQAVLDPDTSALFEPAFIFNDVTARVDVLQRVDDDRWDLIEVKGATNRKDVYLRDLAIQFWILRGAGVQVRRAGLLLLNKKYVHDGVRLDLDQLFTFVDLTAEALAMHDEIEALVASLQRTISKAEAPKIAPGDHCRTPYECPYYATCTKDTVQPEHPVKDLPRIHPGQVRKLTEMGVDDINDIPADFVLNETQARVRESVIRGQDWTSDELARALANISYPVHHLDFETFMPAIPVFADTRPFEAVPFQYSIHRETEDAALEHLEYLCTTAEAPHCELAEQLLSDLGEQGSICVYSSFEKNVIRALARRLPDLREALEKLVPRIWDLLPIIRNHYYHPGFHGSFSIKNVLPVLVPGRSYDNMEIGGGMAAASKYEIARESEDEGARDKTHHDLRIYCGRDTKAMVELRSALARKGR